MIFVLNHNRVFKNETLQVMNCNVEFNTQDDIARLLGISISGLKKRIRKLKRDGMLKIHRYRNNNFIYLIGGDAFMDWDAKEARHIAIHRKHKFEEDIDEPTSLLYPLFKGECVPLEFSKEEKELMDVTVDMLLQDLRS